MEDLTVDVNEISLRFYNSSFLPQLENYYLSEGHMEYTGLPMEAIEKCSEENNRYPIIVDYHSIPVGFFVLHGWEGVRNYCNNKHALLLRTYSIDTRYQGKGIAKQSLKLLPDFMKKQFPHTNEIILVVNHRNIHAQLVYKSCGFVDKGQRVIGRKGEQFIFHMQV